MNDSKVPMIPGRKQSLPRVYGDTPTFLGIPHVKIIQGVSTDIALLGVPWEGTITWGSFSGCELTPKTVRHASARYGGYLPEFDIDLFDHLHLVDTGDVAVTPGDELATMHSIEERCLEIYNNKTVPFLIGGDHSFSPAVVKALARTVDGPIGIVHFDSHFDNAEQFGSDIYPRCGPIHHIASIPQVNKTSIVQFGIRGPRNSKRQMEYAHELGVSVLTINDIRTMGFEASVNKALSIAYSGTKAVYVSICSDILDAVFNPGGPADFDGLSPRELFYALRNLGEKGIAGLDYVEVYPLQDSKGFSSHLVVWAMIHALCGMAKRKIRQSTDNG
jgi:agmatinase